MELGRKSIIKRYADVAAVFLASRICFLIIAFVQHATIINLIYLLDSKAYIHIANNGYNMIHLTAFFPMLPLLFRYLGEYGVLALNQVCLFLSMLALKDILNEEYNCKYTSHILIIFAFSPVSYISLTGYTESLFFFLTITAYYLFAKNKYPWLMGIMIGFSVCTRNTGSIIFFAVFIGMVIRWFKKKTKILDIIVAYVPATVLSLVYPVYLQLEFNNWKLFVDIQYDIWNRSSSNLFMTMFVSLKMIFTDEYAGNFDIKSLTLFRVNEVLTILITVLFICLCIKEIKKFRNMTETSVVAVLIAAASVYIYTSAIGDPNVNAPTGSCFRYYLAMFPVFTLLYDLHPRLIDALVIVFVFASLAVSGIFYKNVFFY